MDRMNLQELQLHLKKQGISQKKYCLDLNKKDLLTKELLKFKTLEQYVLSDFENKNNLKKWLELNKGVALKYLKNKLKEYCELKDLSATPSENIFKTISYLPIPATFEFLAKKPFNEICKELNIPCSFDYSKEPPARYKEIKKIIGDSREQKLIVYSELSQKNECLKWGDYSETQFSKIRCERKSSSDFCGSISKGYERFDREMKRAAADDGYIVIVVESSLSSTFYSSYRFGRASSSFLEHRMRELLKNNPNCQILFTDSREEAKRCIKKILSIGESIKNYDLQYFYNKHQF